MLWAVACSYTLETSLLSEPDFILKIKTYLLLFFSRFGLIDILKSIIMRGSDKHKYCQYIGWCDTI